MNKVIASILFFFLCLFLYTKFIGPFPFAVNSVTTSKTDLFQVTGEGSATAVPDTAHIVFGVTKQAPTITDAQNQTNTAVTSIMDALKQIGVSTKDLKTTDYSVSPNYNFTGGSQSITGYTVTQTIDLKVQPLDKVNKVLDTITKSGANLVGQVSFGFTDQKQQQLEDQARKEAVAKARSKAESLAKAAGIHLGPIVNLQENNEAPIPRPLSMGIALKAEDSTNSAPTQVTPGTATVNTTVTLSYQLY